MNPDDYLIRSDNLVGIHKDCFIEDLLDDDEMVALWDKVPVAERQAMLQLVCVHKQSDKPPSVELIVDMAKQFGAQPSVVLAGWGWVPERPLTPCEADAFLVWRNIQTDSWANGEKTQS